MSVSSFSENKILEYVIFVPTSHHHFDEQDSLLFWGIWETHCFDEHEHVIVDLTSTRASLSIWQACMSHYHFHDCERVFIVLTTTSEYSSFWQPRACRLCFGEHVCCCCCYEHEYIVNVLMKTKFINTDCSDELSSFDEHACVVIIYEHERIFLIFLEKKSVSASSLFWWTWSCHFRFEDHKRVDVLMSTSTSLFWWAWSGWKNLFKKKKIY